MKINNEKYIIPIEPIGCQTGVNLQNNKKQEIKEKIIELKAGRTEFEKMLTESIDKLKEDNKNKK